MFVHFILRQCLFLKLKRVSCRQRIDGFYFLIHLVILCLLIGELNLMIFKVVIIERFVLIAVKVLLILVLLFIFSYFNNYALVFLSAVSCLCSFLHSSLNIAPGYFFRFSMLVIIVFLVVYIVDSFSFLFNYGI